MQLIFLDTRHIWLVTSH